VNVGSVGQSRDGVAKATYVIYDLDEGSIELRRSIMIFPGPEKNSRAVCRRGWRTGWPWEITSGFRVRSAALEARPVKILILNRFSRETWCRRCRFSAC